MSIQNIYNSLSCGIMHCAFCGKACAPGNAAAAKLRYGKIETKESSGETKGHRWGLYRGQVDFFISIWTCGKPFSSLAKNITFFFC